MRVLIAALFVVASSSVAVAQEPARPGQEHEVLKQFEGAWDIAVKAKDPMSGKESETKGSETCRMQEGGFWLIIDHKSELMGMPFHGHGMLGYDPIKKKYAGSWADNLSPTMYALEGTWDAAKKTMTTKITGIEPGTGAELKLTMVQTFKDKDSFTHTISVTMPDGKDVQTLSSTYTRKK
jgi:hypothetical protein